MNDRAGLAPRFHVHSRFAAERVLRAVEKGRAPSVRDVRDLARAVLTAAPVTVLAWRLLRQPVARLRSAEVAKLAEQVLERASGTAAHRAGTGKGTP